MIYADGNDSREVKMSTTDTIHVAYCVDIPNAGGMQFMDMLAVSISTLGHFASQANDKVIVHIMYGNLRAVDMERIRSLESDLLKIETKPLDFKFINALQKYAKPIPNGPQRGWTGIVYARLWLPQFLSNVDKVIYLDSDTMVRASLKPLWDTDLEGNLLGMVKGTIEEYGFNSGVMIIDLAAIRADKGHFERLSQFIRERALSFYCPDQTVINRFYARKIKELPIEWNFGPMPGAHKDPNMAKARIWHFYNGGRKPTRLVYDDFSAGALEWNRWLAQSEGRKL